MPSLLELSIHARDEQWKSLLKPYTKTVHSVCEAAYLAAGGKQKGRELAVVLANDAFVRDLNHQYRGFDKPTNVLSFSGEGDYLGDIVMARQTVMREAKEQGKTARDHAMHLLVHGMLHLMGHDHEKQKDAKAMETLEIKTLEKLGVSNPYL